jgi:hypothetical protein
VVVFPFFIELTQRFHLIEILNLEQYAVAHWVLGSSFNWWDFMAYGMGLALAILIENLLVTSTK